MDTRGCSRSTQMMAAAPFSSMDQQPSGTLITDLPAHLLQQLAAHLDVDDAVSCRLASPALAACRPPGTGRRLVVLASSFHQQLTAEGAAAGSSSSLTCRSLAAAAGRAESVELNIDVSCEPCLPAHASTWELTFGALLAAPSSVSALTVTELLSFGEDSEAGLQAAALLEARSSSTDSPAAPNLAEAAAQCAWLPALVQQYTQRQQQQQESPPLCTLHLGLLACLPPHMDAHLLQLTGLTSLAVAHTSPRLWTAPSSQRDKFPLPVAVAPGVLKRLPQLRSLVAAVGATAGQTPSQAATALHDLLVSSGTRLTQLTLCGWGAGTSYGVAAPWRSMPALRDLTVGANCWLENLPQRADSGSSSSSSSSRPRGTALAQEGAAPARRAAAVLPALTELCLVDPLSRQVLRAIVRRSPAACRQLTHLHLPSGMVAELDSHEQPDDSDDDGGADDDSADEDGERGAAAALPVGPPLLLLQHLRGLRSLSIGGIELHAEVEQLAAAVGDRLSALTVTVVGHEDAIDFTAASNVVKLAPLLGGGMRQLTSLHVYGPAAVLNMDTDLAAAAKHMSSLRELSFRGRFATARAPWGAPENARMELKPGMLPAQLRGLTLTTSREAVNPLVLSAGSLPNGLTGLCLSLTEFPAPEVAVGGQPPQQQQSSSSSMAYGWRLLPPGLGQLQLSVLPSALLPPDDAEAGRPAAHAPAALPRLLPRLQLAGFTIIDDALDEAETRDVDVAYVAALVAQLAEVSPQLRGLHITTDWPVQLAGWHLAGLPRLRHLQMLALLWDHFLFETPFVGQRLDPEDAAPLVANLSRTLTACQHLRKLMLPHVGGGDVVLRELQARLPHCLVMRCDDGACGPELWTGGSLPPLRVVWG